ncbi:RNA-directed DNA polymerase, eukaryota [Tanacetum coccineum]
MQLTSATENMIGKQEAMFSVAEVNYIGRAKGIDRDGRLWKMIACLGLFGWSALFWGMQVSTVWWPAIFRELSANVCLPVCLILHQLRMKLNFHKSTLMGVVVSYDEVEDMATYIGCKFTKKLGTYLGINVGENRARIDSWKEVISKTLISCTNLASMKDIWVWKLESMGNFTVRSVRIGIDKEMLIINGAPTRWCKLVKNKANIMVWKMALDRLPTRVTLDARGLDIPSVLCPICEECSESTTRDFFQCLFVAQVYNRLGM